MKINYYNKDGRYNGHSEKTEDVGIIGFAFILLLIGASLKWLWNKIDQWYLLSSPYNYVAAFYNYIVLEPLRVFGYIWEWSQNAHFTKYSNLNMTISIALVFIYFVSVIVVLKAVYKNSELGKKILLVTPTILITPFIFGLAWYLITTAFQWLFEV